MRKIVEASKPTFQSKNLASEQSDTTAVLKVTKNNNETSTQPIKETIRIDREQQTSITATNPPSIDPALITTIHANKGAIETIRGQITELRSDVDHLRRQINHRKRSTLINNTSPANPPVTTSPPPVENPPKPVPKTNDNSNAASYSHHHHHHHHLQPTNSTGRSSVCIVL